MKLTIEKHPDFERLAYCFQKIEDMAERMGVDVDELIHPSGNNTHSLYTSFKRDLHHLSQKRIKTLLNADERSETTPTQDGFLSVRR